MMTFVETKEAFLRLIYTARCGVCRQLLPLEETLICGICFRKLSESCFNFENAVLNTRKLEHLDQAWALAPYAEPLQDILTAIKFNGKRALVRVFFPLITPLLSAIAAENHYDLIIPVPIDRGRLARREFNQSELFARLVRKATGIPVTRSLLKKPRPTPVQSRLGREERQINLWGAFRATKRVDGKNLLLVDDIFTTGATADEAARTLKNAGASRVDIFTIASTPEPR